MKKSILFIAVAIFSINISCTKEELKPQIEESNSSIKILKTAGTLLWDGAASNGTSVFKALEFQDNDGNYGSTNGSSVAKFTDTSEGIVWKFHKDDLDRRCEARGATGITVTVGNTYYIGYRFKLYEVRYWPDLGHYFALNQWKTYGSPNLQNYPVLVTMSNGNFTVQHFKDGGEGVNLFKQAVSANVWYSVVIKIKVGNTTSTGNVQVWWGSDSTPETLLTGGTSYKCKTFDGTSIEPKWGYYHETNRDGNIYFSRLKIGTTYDIVNPNNSQEQKINISGSSVVASEDDGNIPSNTVDGNLSTRWSAYGDGQWIKYDLGSLKTIASAKLAFYKGDERTASFEIQTSSDGTSFTTVGGTRSSSGTTNSLQTFNINSVGRYVRILGHGNSSNLWNSITETEVWGY